MKISTALLIAGVSATLASPVPEKRGVDADLEARGWKQCPAGCVPAHGGGGGSWGNGGGNHGGGGSWGNGGGNHGGGGNGGNGGHGGNGGGGGGSKGCSSSQKQVCCSGIGCLISAGSCNNNAYCCETGQESGLININILDCSPITL